MMVLRSLGSAMFGADDAHDEEGELGSAAGGEGGAAAADGEVDRPEDRLDLDTRLSRALNPWVAGPRLRSS